MRMVTLLVAGSAFLFFSDGSANAGQTLGDLSPMIMDLDTRPMEAVSPEEAVNEYLDLFHTVSDPEIRVFALDRIHHLQQTARSSLGIAADQERALYQESLSSYAVLLDDNRDADGSDGLLYRAARAHALAEDQSGAMVQLEDLIQRHPESDYRVEAHFRVAEYSFSNSRYATARDHYRQVMDLGDDTHFADKAQYMVGWAEFHLDRHDDAGASFVAVLDRHHEQESGFDQLSRVEQATVDDTLRILSIMAAYDGGADAVARLFDRHGHRDYAYGLYHRLARFYLESDRHIDSVRTSEAFTARYPDHAQAPLLADYAIVALERGRYTDRLRDARTDFVARFGGPNWVGELDQDLRARLLTHLDVLGQWHYRRAQGLEDQEAQTEAFLTASEYLERWTEVAVLPGTETTDELGSMRSLAADAARQGQAPERAMALYASAAYDSPGYTRAEDAAYALVLMHRERWEDRPSSLSREEALDDLAEASLKYVEHFPRADEAPAVQTYLANRLYQENRYKAASDVARALVDNPRAPDSDRRAGWLVLGHIAMNENDGFVAESAYAKVLALIDDNTEQERDVRERRAAAVYLQAEAAEDAGDVDEAVSHYQRIPPMVPGSTIAINATFDAANALLRAERWSGAIAALSGFSDSYPDHDLAQRVPDMLVFAYQESGQPGKAADALLQAGGADMSAEEQWRRQLRAADLYEEAGRKADAMAINRRYLNEGTSAFGDHEFHQQRRHDLALFYRDQGRFGESREWHRRILSGEEAGEGTDRSRHLASRSALELGHDAADEYRDIGLRAPLPDSLKRKRSAMEEAVNYYQQAQSFGFADTVTESTYALGELYRHLATAIMDSDRPGNLNELQAEQYDMLLEEQAYPFEERAIGLHQENQERIPSGIWTLWVERSLAVLADLYPARYARETKWADWNDDS